MRLTQHNTSWLRARLCWLALLMVLSGLSASLAAQESPQVRVFREGRAWTEETGGLLRIPTGKQLQVRSERGNVIVHVGEPGQVSYRIYKRAYDCDEEQARTLFRDFVVSVERTSAGVVFRSAQQQPVRDFSDFVVRYEITVPAAYHADIETRGGKIEVDDLEGGLRAVTAGGNIHTGNLGGQTTAETKGGDISLGQVGGPLQAVTAGGDIRVESVQGEATLVTRGGEIMAGRVEGNLHAETAGGDIYIRGALGDVSAETAGGRIVIGESGGRVRAQTAGGRILIAGAAGPVEAATQGGGIELTQIRKAVQAATSVGNIVAHILGEGKQISDSLLETSFGDVQVYLQPELAVTIEAVIEMAAGHRIESEFPLKIEGVGTGYGLTASQVRGLGELNGGGQRLRIRTVAGDIEIRKLTPHTLRRIEERQDNYWKQWQERFKRPWQRKR